MSKKLAALMVIILSVCLVFTLYAYPMPAYADEAVLFSEEFASIDEVKAKFSVYGDGANVSNGSMVLGGDGSGMILTEKNDFADFIVDVKYEVLNNVNSSGKSEVGVLLRAGGDSFDSLNGMLVGLEYIGGTMNVTLGYYFDGQFESAGYWDAGWGKGFAERNLRIVVKNDTVSVIINNWQAFVALDKYFDTGSVGFISKNIACKIDDFTVREAPESIYPALTREQWKGCDTIQDGKQFAKGENHSFDMQLPDAEIKSLTLYRRADHTAVQAADIIIDGKKTGTWNASANGTNSSDLAFNIPESAYINKNKLHFEVNCIDGAYTTDYYFLVYETDAGAFIADSVDVGNAYDEKSHNFVCGENIKWDSFYKRFFSTDDMLIISARKGATFDYVMKPSAVASDIEVSEDVTRVDLKEYVKIGKTGFGFTEEYYFCGKKLDGSIAEITENGEFAYSVKLVALPFNKYSQQGAIAFDPITASGTVKRSEKATEALVIDKATVYDKIFGGWTGANWGTYAGLDTECKFNHEPNPSTEMKWNLGQGYCTDDDTNVEYMFLHMMEVYGVNDIAYEDMPEEWLTHCQNYIWCANETARNLMSGGLMPPLTGSKEYNSNWSAIDAQIESAIFGMIAPGMLENTYTRSIWWLKSVGDGYALENAAYYAMLCSAAFTENDINKAIDKVSSAILIYSEGRAQSSVEIVNFVTDSYNNLKTEYETNKEAWRKTRAQIYNKYWNGSSVDANVNFALTMMSLIYGQNDFEETARIAVLAGCDNDCNAATACTISAMLCGFNGLPEKLRAQSGYMYLNSRRPGLTDDTFDNITKRIMAQGEEVIASCGGSIDEQTYTVMDKAFEPKSYSAAEYSRKVPVKDKGWTHDGFEKIYNPEIEGKIGYVSIKSGAKLTYTFDGSSVGVSAMLCPGGGRVEIYVDGISYGTASLKTDPADGASGSVSVCYGQTIKKIRGLSEGSHVLEIIALDEGKQHLIEYASIACSKAEYLSYLEEYYASLPAGTNLAQVKGVKVICSVMTPGPGSGGNPSVSVINDGKYFTDFSNLKQQYDTFLGFDNAGKLVEKNFDDYFGFTYDAELTFGKVIFHEGGHWNGGGWFANGDVRVEVLTDDGWVNAEYSIDKPYPVGNTLADFGPFGETYTFTLKNKTKGKGIRIIGTPGGSQKLASCAEMEVYL